MVTLRTIIDNLSRISTKILFSHHYSKSIVIDSLTKSIFVLRNNFGGNMGILTGDDGILLIDSHTKGFIECIQNRISKISSLPVKYIINTHWHFDHVDNNETFASQGTIIISHDNCRARLSEDQVIPIFLPRQAASPQKGLPVITFTESMNIFFNDETVNVIHLDNAHTNSDVVVFFGRSNIVQTGDIFVRYGIPYIDVENGGSFDGIITACEYILSHTDERTKVIPGHGSVSNKQVLKNYTDMLKKIRNRIVKGIQNGYSMESIINSNPAKEFNSVVEKSRLIELYYKSLYRTF